MDWLARHGTCRMLFLPLSCEKSLDNFSTRILKTTIMKTLPQKLDWKLQDGDALLSLSCENSDISTIGWLLVPLSLLFHRIMFSTVFHMQNNLRELVGQMDGSRDIFQKGSFSIQN